MIYLPLALLYFTLTHVYYNISTRIGSIIIILMELTISLFTIESQKSHEKKRKLIQRTHCQSIDVACTYVLFEWYISFSPQKIKLIFCPLSCKKVSNCPKCSMYIEFLQYLSFTGSTLASINSQECKCFFELYKYFHDHTIQFQLQQKPLHQPSIQIAHLTYKEVLKCIIFMYLSKILSFTCLMEDSMIPFKLNSFLGLHDCKNFLELNEYFFKTLSYPASTNTSMSAFSHDSCSSKNSHTTQWTFLYDIIHRLNRWLYRIIRFGLHSWPMWM